MNLLLVKSFVRVFTGELGGPQNQADEKQLEEMAETLRQKILAMPWLMRLALCCLTYIFDWSGFLCAGQRFCGQSAESQRRMVRSGQIASPGPFKELLKFYQKMSVYIYYS